MQGQYNPSVAVVILNWNKAELTRTALSVAQSNTRFQAHWIVVDNGSSEPITNLPPDVVILRNHKNLGFAGGVNTGIRHAMHLGADYIWLLNNDAEPLPETLDTLIEAVKNNDRIGLASPVILNSDENDRIDWHGSALRDGVLSSTVDPITYSAWVEREPQNICLTGTALLVSRKLIEAIGYFDEKLFAYWEDTDISIRAVSAGYRAIVVSDAKLRHSCGTDALDAENRAPYYYYLMTRNEIILLRKIKASWRSRYWMLRRALRWWRKPGLHPSQRGAIMRGIIDGMINRGGPPRV